MRLGAFACKLTKKTKVFDAYSTENISERHRHRYEFNNVYLDQFIKHGMVPTGINPDSKLIEIMEIPAHKWFVGVQFHPEYKSTLMNPHPLFQAFIKSTISE
jgi:CTP synthase